MRCAITLTHYTGGEGTPHYTIPEELLGIEAALADMFSRLRAGAETTTSGYNYGLVTYCGPDDEPTGTDRAIYGGISPQIQDFLIRSPKRWSKELVLGTPEHDQFIRQTLLTAIGLSLPEQRLAFALAMSEADFLAAVALAIEGEEIDEIFSPNS